MTNKYCITLERLTYLHDNIGLILTPNVDPRKQDKPFSPEIPQDLIDTWFTFLDAKDKLNLVLEANNMERI